MNHHLKRTAAKQLLTLITAPQPYHQGGGTTGTGGENFRNVSKLDRPGSRMDTRRKSKLVLHAPAAAR